MSDTILSAYAVPAGHFDELLDAAGEPRAWWAALRARADLSAAHLSHAQARVARQMHENGVTYNVYAAEDGPNRLWTLDVLPHVIDAGEWSSLESGLRQRARLLNALAADVYGPQHVLRDGIVPPALVFQHRGYLRACHGVLPRGGVFVHLVAFDLARHPDGRWLVAGSRTQAPSGAGYALENRATIPRLFPAAFRELHVEPLAPFFDELRQTLAAAAPCDEGTPHIGLLTPGPYNETYFEQSYLAKYLGFSLVEGADLTVRDDRVFLKTISGLRPLHAILRRLDDDYCDPLELRNDSTLGVPGLVQAWRAGRVLVANAFGTGVLESPDLCALLPAISRRLLGESLPMESADDPDSLPLSHAPVWQNGRLESRRLVLRVFLGADGHGDYRLMPGGLVRIAGDLDPIVSGQRGGGSKDMWVLSARPFTPAPTRVPGESLRQNDLGVSSRAAEHLFWLGRYAERAENGARLLRAVLSRLSDPSSAPHVPQAFVKMC
ncbi:MAG TPA: circularly permuted type 2 ATP-grasp protein, partial [Vicinamibacterales bacterium]|nr:circularly permuted type 2 ATP-grasp protein [Vicinamibacterales bacterium]